MTHPTLWAVLALLAALTLAGCGGGGGSPSGSASHPGTPTGPQQIGADIRTGEGTTVGIGPAFNNESPAIGDLATVTFGTGGEIHSGFWRGTADGSKSAAELLAFLQAFQDQADADGEGDIIIGRPGVPKTLRIGAGATRQERAVVRQALAKLNTVLPWDQRLRLGTDLTTPLPVEAIPDDAIHLHFTTGKAGWPDPEAGAEPWDENTLGIGGATFDPDTFMALGGQAYIDRTAAPNRTRTRLLNTVLHELLHAWGVGAHVDPDQYPASILQPYNDPDVNPDLYVTLDGEASLRALSRLPAGTRIRDLTVADFGLWETTGFHLLVWIALGGTNTDDLQGGIGWRNGQPTPWVWGPQPDRTLAHLGARATWTGTLLGFTRDAGRTVRGAAALTADFDRQDGQADFTRLETWPHRTHPGAPGTGTPWGDGDLGYTLTLWEDGTQSGFDSAFAAGDDPGVVTGVFVGTAHEGAAGVLEHPDLAAAFGAVRE